MNKKKDKYFEGYSLFTASENKTNQAYNRIITFWNIMSDVGGAKASAYIKNFNDEDKAEMRRLLVIMENEGMQELRRKVIAEEV